MTLVVGAMSNTREQKALCIIRQYNHLPMGIHHHLKSWIVFCPCKIYIRGLSGFCKKLEVDIVHLYILGEEDFVCGAFFPYSINSATKGLEQLICTGL